MKKMMDYLARRNHTELELREKLKGRYEVDEIENAINHAKNKAWIAGSEEASMVESQEIAAALKSKGKGIHYINQYLSKKGLPEISSDSGEELEKARQLVENKFDSTADLSPEESEKQKAKRARFLASRGFDEEIVRKVIYEE